MKKILLIVSCIFIFLGVAFVGTGLYLGVKRYEKVTRDVNGEFLSVSIDISSTDINIKKSENGKAYIVAKESDKVKYNLSIENDTLLIKEKDTRKWYEHIEINLFESVYCNLYLPANTYDNLKIKASSSNVASENSEIAFNTATITLSSGNVNLSSKVLTSLSIKTASGNLKIKNNTLNDLTATASSGNIYLNNVIATTSLKATTSSGNITLKSCDSNSITLKVSSGNVNCKLLTGKLFETKAGSGNISCPASTAGNGTCKVTTGSGNIKITIA